jgi:putative transcriptional regulator
MRKKKSAILEAVHQTATDLHKAGLMNQTTLREFERLCLTPTITYGSQQPRQQDTMIL